MAARYAQNAVVQITWNYNGGRKAYSSGCCVTEKENTLIVLSSARQLLDMPLDRVEVMFQQGELKLEGRLVRASAKYDLSVIRLTRVDSLGMITSVRFNEAEMPMAQSLWTIHSLAIMHEIRPPVAGLPDLKLLLPFSFSKGYITCCTRSIIDKFEVPYIHYSVPQLGFGSPGAPMFNERDEIVALHSYQVGDRQFGTHVASIREFLENVCHIPGEGRSLNEMVADLE